MMRPVVVVVLTTGMLTGCGSDTFAPEGATASFAPLLTAEEARGAIIELIGSSKAGDLRDFPLDRYKSKPVDYSSDSPSWGPFFFSLKGRRYCYTIAYGQPPRVCRWYYQGEFMLDQGKWVAMPPRVESQTLGPE